MEVFFILWLYYFFSRPVPLTTQTSCRCSAVREPLVWSSRVNFSSG
uniref:Uncharacterized protein n=1 Tax=Anopheles dirus TaxID=7168 RepID=A0A182NY54_9DIPT